MVEKKKGKQTKDDEEKPTSEEYAVAKDLRFSLPVKEGRLHGMDVKYFIGSEAVDRMMESKWSSSKSKDAIFTNREKCVSYMQRLLKKNMFHRAEREKRKKDRIKDKSTKKKIKDKEETTQPEEEIKNRESNERKSKRERRSKKDKEVDGGEEAEKKVQDKKEEKKKKEKRLKLVMPEKQFFEDSNEVYVWIFDPVNAKNFMIGLLMVLGAIALCMFPLWPEAVRVGVYYLSVAAAGFVGFILCLVVVRLVLFCCIWVLTFGKHHFWFLPNLTEDVGFFDSFRPLYKHDIVSKDAKAVEAKKKRSKNRDEEDKQALGIKKDKSSDKEDSEFELIKQEDLTENASHDDEDVDEDLQDRTDDGEIDDSSADVEEDKENVKTENDSKKKNL
ncbi:Translocation protein S62 [Bulinus truncatus]|nr:Translocation protein S62 [Bulinus truncatus]